MGKFKYSMQNILDIKIKLETQAKNEFSEANRAYLIEKEKLEELFKKRAVYEAALKEQLSGSLNISEINICKKNINSLKSAIRTQLMNVKKAEDMLEVKRVALNELMKERKTHEKLRDKKFEDFQKEEKDNESKAPDSLTTLGLGSCIGLTLYDPASKIGGLVHYMLPDSTKLRNNTNIAKFGDTGIRELYNQMIKNGANPRRMVAKIAGGAKMFEMSGNSTIGNVGDRNTDMARHVLAELKIPLKAQDTGLNYGRTVILDCETGDYIIKAVGKEQKVI